MSEADPQREHISREVFNGLRWMSHLGDAWRLMPFRNANVAYGGASPEFESDSALNWRRKPPKERCLTA